MSEKITAEQAARRLGVTVRTIWNWRDSGKLKEAGRAGRTVMFYALDVDRLLGIDATRDLTLADVYMRLAGLESWEDVDALRRDVAATLCTNATEEGREAVAQTYHAVCAMAATHPDEDAAARAARRAHMYGGWLRKTDGETDRLISEIAERATYEDAKAESKVAPYDPAYVVAKLEKSR